MEIHSNLPKLIKLSLNPYASVIGLDSFQKRTTIKYFIFSLMIIPKTKLKKVFYLWIESDTFQISSLRKQVTFRDTTTGFSVK